MAVLRTSFRRSILTTVALTCAGGAAADCGSIPFYAPLLDGVQIVSTSGPGSGGPAAPGGSPSAVAHAGPGGERRLQFDPLKVTVFEPKQRAIILWNGVEEILLLSTDQRASAPSAVLEVIPLPSEPQVRLGSFDTFQKAQKLVVEKRMWACAHGGAAAGLAKLPPAAGKVTFSQKMGAHDLTVAQVSSPDRFVEFVQGYLKEKYQSPDAPIRPEFVKIIQSYLDEGYRWFAFDVIQMDGTVQSREPIEYRFKSDRVHYPLRISSLEKGETEAELLVFTGSRLSQFTGIPARQMEREPQLDLRPAEVSALDDAWKGFFPESSGVVLNQWTIEGKSSELQRDVAVR